MCNSAHCFRLSLLQILHHPHLLQPLQHQRPLPLSFFLLHLLMISPSLEALTLLLLCCTTFWPLLICPSTLSPPVSRWSCVSLAAAVSSASRWSPLAPRCLSRWQAPCSPRPRCARRCSSPPSSTPSCCAARPPRGRGGVVGPARPPPPGAPPPTQHTPPGRPPGRRLGGGGGGGGAAR